MPVLARGCIDARDPQRAELALAVAAVAIGILPGAHDRFVGDAEHVLAAAAETFGLREELSCAPRARLRRVLLLAWSGSL